MIPRAKTSSTIKVGIGLLLVTLSVAMLPQIIRNSRLQSARRQWKNNAIRAIASFAEDGSWRAKEIEILTKQTNHQRVIAEGWLTDKMILMKSSEWLVYRSHCSKEEPHLVDDIFLAKGSNGKWYYSTFHFCVGMMVLVEVQETQPPDLAMFVHEYNLREFDGRSDECLKKTASWPASGREKQSGH